MRMKSHLQLLFAFCVLISFAGCGGGGSSTSSSIALQLASPTLTISDNSSGSDAVTLTRTGTTGSVTLGLTGLPAGATVAITNPGSSNSGQITVTLATTAAGSYPLSLRATDGTNSASIGLTLVVNPAPSDLGLQLASPSLTISAAASASDAVTLTRTGTTTGSVTLSLSGLPAGATVSYLNPASSNSGRIILIDTTAAAGTYPLTLQATDGTSTASSNLSLTVNSASEPTDPYAWSSTGPIISAIPDATHSLIAVKDPTAVYYNNQWNVYASSVDSNGDYNMVYLHFPDWSQASAAQPYYMDQNPNLAGYHCAPELFYFAPQNKWYLIYQSGPPTYSTADDPTQPATWTAPQYFFSGQPSTVSNWIDFWVICDTANCYLFFSGDNGNYYRSQTTVANFPNGFDTPQIILQATNAGDLFEASRVYSLKGSTGYLALIECMGGNSGHRYFRAFTAASLDGIWTPATGANSWDAPFLGSNDVSFASGVTAWTDDFSHGEVLRTGTDELLQIDPANLQFLYQGDNPAAGATSYNAIPWQLGLATATSY